MTVQVFRTDRSDGRSDRQVILDLVAESQPGDLFSYDQLKVALMVGTDRVFDHAAVGNAVRAARDVWLTQSQRTLRVIRGEGYKVCAADEHSGLALDRKRRADQQMKRGLSLLNNVRWAELSPEARKAHEGTLLVVGALAQKMSLADRRSEGIEDVLNRLVRRIDHIEDSLPRSLPPTTAVRQTTFAS